MRAVFAISLVAGLLAGAGPVIAAPYGVLEIDARGVRLIDLGSIRKSGALVRYDVASISRPPVEAAVPGLVDVRHRKEMDCAQKRMRLLEMKLAMGGGEPTAPPWAEMPGDWTEVDSQEFPVVCRGVRPMDRFPTLDEARAAMLKLGEPDRVPRH